MRSPEKGETPSEPHGTGLLLLAAGPWPTSTSFPTLAFSQHVRPTSTLPSTHTLRLTHAACLTRDRKKRQLLLHQLFDGQTTSIDFPGFAFVDDLLDMYPACRVVLNRASSAEAWTSSARARLAFFATARYALLTWWVPQGYWLGQVFRAYRELAKRRYGVEDVFSKEYYKWHCQWVHVSAKARGKDVLEWEPGMGMETLCQFTGREVPREILLEGDGAAAVEQLKRDLVIRGLIAWAAVLGVTALAVFAFLWTRG